MEARITRKTAALAIFLISAFQTYIYAGRPSSCQLLIINSYTENCLWSDDFMAPVYKEFRVQNSPVDICAEHMELMATVVPDMRKQVFMSDRRWISAQCRKEAEEVMPFLLIGGYFWTDSEIKKHLLPVIKSRLDGASHPHRVETAAPIRHQLCRLRRERTVARPVSRRHCFWYEAPHFFRAEQILSGPVFLFDGTGRHLCDMAPEGAA